MGADIIGWGWRDCPLQRDLGEEGFLGKLKLRAYKAEVERRVPPERREQLAITVNIMNRPSRDLRYRDICDEVARFAAEVHVAPKGRLKPARVAKQAVDGLREAHASAASRTLTELREVQAMLLRMLHGAADHGWTVVVDG